MATGAKLRSEAMRLAFPSFSSAQAGALLRRRTTAFAIVVAGHLLLMLLFLHLSPPLASPAGEKVSSFELLPDRSEQQEETQDEAEETEEAIEPPTPPEIVSAPPPPVELPYKLPIISLTREDFAAADIAKMPKAEGAAADAASPGDSVPLPGSGPNGEPIYNAEWQRRPTQAELAYYVPAYVPRPGWALIACQTAERFRVENCQEVGQSHGGVASAAAIREAAWQFRVIPPRKGGKRLIGAWVQIRIDFLEAEK